MAIPIDTNLRLQNDSQLRGEGWWEWSVWVEGPPEELELLELVTYRLHPTFPQPVQQVRDAATRFRLRSAGWGEFAIVADARFKDGHTVRLERWLKLGDEAKPRGISFAPTATRQPTVFVSHSVADNTLVNALREALARQGVQVSSERNIGSGCDWEQELRELLKGADIVLPVFSDPPSDFVEAQAKLALAVGRPVLPIVVSNALLPSSLGNRPHFELREPRNVAGLADKIVARVKDLIVPEEG